MQVSFIAFDWLVGFCVVCFVCLRGLRHDGGEFLMSVDKFLGSIGILWCLCMHWA